MCGIISGTSWAQSGQDNAPAEDQHAAEMSTELDAAERFAKAMAECREITGAKSIDRLTELDIKKAEICLAERGYAQETGSYGNGRQDHGDRQGVVRGSVRQMGQASNVETVGTPPVKVPSKAEVVNSLQGYKNIPQKAEEAPAPDVIPEASEGERNTRSRVYIPPASRSNEKGSNASGGKNEESGRSKPIFLGR